MVSKFVEDFEAIFGRKPEEDEPAGVIQEQPVVETKVVAPPAAAEVQPAVVAETE